MKHSIDLAHCLVGGCAIILLCAVIPMAGRAQTFTTLTSFSGSNGSNPLFAPLVQGTDGNLYGTASAGGAHSQGTVFKITRSGTLTTLYSFCAQSKCTDGSAPYAGLIQGRDGNFYGTTASGATAGQGTRFTIEARERLPKPHTSSSRDA